MTTYWMVMIICSELLIPRYMNGTGPPDRTHKVSYRSSTGQADTTHDQCDIPYFEDDRMLIECKNDTKISLPESKCSYVVKKSDKKIVVEDYVEPIFRERRK